MSFLSFFKKKHELKNPFIVDIHSHLIPGLDDGAKHLEDSIELAERLVSFGYKKIITTPHVMLDVFNNTHEQILEGHKILVEALESQGIPLEVEVAAEYNLDEGFIDKIQEGELLCFGKRKYVLFELPKMSKPFFTDQVIFDIFSAGYQPVLAHPERYHFMHHELEQFVKWKDQGLLLQLNLNSLTGFYSPQIKKFSEKLLKKGLIDFVGSDCHKMRHLDLLETVLTSPKKLELIAQNPIKNARLLENKISH